VKAGDVLARLSVPEYEKQVKQDTADVVRAEARVDGKRVVLEGNDEVVLKCGEASITLRRDGKIILRGSSADLANNKQVQAAYLGI